VPVLKNELEFAQFGTLLTKVHYTCLLKKQTRNNGSDKVKLPKVGSNAIVPVPVGAEPNKF
jgi:hypothetical protein